MKPTKFEEDIVKGECKTKVTIWLVSEQWHARAESSIDDLTLLNIYASAATREEVQLRLGQTIACLIDSMQAVGSALIDDLEFRSTKGQLK